VQTLMFVDNFSMASVHAILNRSQQLLLLRLTLLAVEFWCTEWARAGASDI